MKKRILASLTLLICFGGGFLFGAFPDYLERYVPWLKNQKLSLGLSLDIPLSQDFQILIYERTGLELQLKTIPDKDNFETQKDHLDAFIVPSAWLDKGDIQNYSPLFVEKKELLSADFHNLTPSSSRLLPVYWNLETQANKNKVTVFLLGFNETNSFFTRKSQLKFRDEFLSPSIYAYTLKSNELRATLKNLSEFIPEKKKLPDSIRELDFHSLEVRSY